MTGYFVWTIVNGDDLVKRNAGEKRFIVCHADTEFEAMLIVERLRIIYGDTKAWYQEA